MKGHAVLLTGIVCLRLLGSEADAQVPGPASSVGPGNPTTAKTTAPLLGPPIPAKTNVTATSALPRARGATNVTPKFLSPEPSRTNTPASAARPLLATNPPATTTAPPAIKPVPGPTTVATNARPLTNLAMPANLAPQTNAAARPANVAGAVPTGPSGAPAAPPPARPPITTFPSFPTPETQPAPAPPPRETVLPAGTIRFPNAPLENVFNVYADLVGRTIIRSPMLPANATVTLNTQTPLTVSEARQALDYVLALNNISMIPMGDKFVLAVPATQALQEAAAFSTAEATNLPEAAQFITEIVKLTNASPTELQPLLTPFSKMPGGIVAIDSSQLIVLRDYAVNVKRMMEVIKRVDVFTEPDYKLEVIPIKYGKVEDIYAVMGSLIGGGGGAPAARTSARGRGGGRMGARGPTTGFGGGPGMTPGLGGQGTTPGGGAAGQSALQRNLAAIVQRAAGGETQILGDAKVIPDQRANSLVVYANKKDMATLTNIVAKLDVMLAQVLIEAVVIDVTLSDSYSFGISGLQNPKQVGKFSGTGGMNNGPSFLSGITNLATGLPSGFSYFGTWAGDLQAAVSAIAANSKANVLQRPRITTTHAVPASFFSGSQIPYSAGNFYGGGYYGSYAPSSFVQYLSVGVELDVTPYITPDGLVVMEVSQTLNDFNGYVDVGGGQKAPQTTQRTADSTISVKNGETIILGGFIRSSRSRTYSGVPLLKDIPLLGGLFRSTSHDNTRSELIVMLRPTIMTTPEEAGRVAHAEENRLPGVRQAEKDFAHEEENILNRADKKK